MMEVNKTQTTVEVYFNHYFKFSLRLQIRMQAEYQTGANVAKKGMIHSFASMSKEEGIRGLYRVLKIMLAIVILIVMNNILTRTILGDPRQSVWGGGGGGNAVAKVFQGHS